MAINKNHLFEELEGVKCGIVEKDVNPERVAFLKDLLEFNGYKVITVASPPPKTPPPAPVKEAIPDDKVGQGEAMAPLPQPVSPETYIVGVTDYTFNPINAVFGRMLKTKDGHVVTQAYWEQKDSLSHDEIPYYEA